MNVSLVPLVLLADVDEERVAEARARAGGVDLIDLGLDSREELAVTGHRFRKYSFVAMASVGPVTARTRTLGLVAAAALAAAGATVGVTLATRSHPAQTVALKPRAGFPPLYLDLGVRTDPAARAIRRGSDLYAHGRHAAALQVFDSRPELEAQVGAALAGWPAGTIQRLEALAAAHPASAVVRLNLGIAEFWAGQGPPAVSACKVFRASGSLVL